MLLCMIMISSIELYLFIQVLMALTIFQGHWKAKMAKIEDALHFLSISVENAKDAPEVTRYREPFEVTPSKMVVKVLQDNVIKYAELSFFH